MAFFHQCKGGVVATHADLQGVASNRRVVLSFRPRSLVHHRAWDCQGPTRTQDLRFFFASEGGTGPFHAYLVEMLLYRWEWLFFLIQKLNTKGRRECVDV